MRKMNCYYQHMLRFTDSGANNSITWIIINASATPITDLTTAINIVKGLNRYYPCNGYNSMGNYVYICGKIDSYNQSTKTLNCSITYDTKASGIVSGTVTVSIPSVIDTVTPLQ